jgi:hypothetical protein
MKVLAARIISVVAHPLILLTLLIAVPFLERDRPSGIYSILAFIGILCVPLVILMWRFVASGQWTTVDASAKDERRSLIKISLGLILIAAAYFWLINRSPSMLLGLVMGAVILLIAAALSPWLKISLHLAFASFCGLILLRVRWQFGVLVLLLVPPLVWSRLILSRHVLSETFGGILLGATTAIAFLWLLH